MFRKTPPKLIELTCLLNDLEFHVGENLGEELGVSRTAIWKMIKKLQDYGIEIGSQKSKGYRLIEPLILLEQNKILHYLPNELTKNISLEIFESLESTNNYLRTLTKAKNISFCLAEHQTQGRGRMNRTWVSPFGKNIYLSCRYPFYKDISALAGLSLVVGLAVVKTLKDYTLVNDFCLKWPNDIYCEHKKLAGILIEILAESHDICHAIIGIGINVNHTKFSKPKMNPNWMSLYQLLEHYIDRNQLAAELIKNILNYLKIFAENGFTRFLSEWRLHDYLYKKMIKAVHQQKEIIGKACGINQYGHLLVQQKDKQVYVLTAGDAHILEMG